MLRSRDRTRRGRQDSQLSERARAYTRRTACAISDEARAAGPLPIQYRRYFRCRRRGTALLITMELVEVRACKYIGRGPDVPSSARASHHGADLPAAVATTEYLVHATSNPQL